MRFDPKYIPADDAPLDMQGEIELPDDLAELAAQLGDDAAYLSRRYPAEPQFAEPVFAERMFPAELAQPAVAEEVVTSPVTSPTRRRNWVLAIAAAAALLLVVANLYRPQTELTIRDAPRNSAPLSNMLARDTTPEAGRSARRLPEAAVLPPTAPPAVFLNGVSGPELEGLLDLWETDGEHDQQDTRISI